MLCGECMMGVVVEVCTTYISHGVEVMEEAAAGEAGDEGLISTRVGR